MKKKVYQGSLILLALLATLSAVAQSNRHPVGTIKVTTQTPGKLYFDNEPAKKMTVYHQVVISGITEGAHILSFKSDSSEVSQELTVTPGQTDYYIIKPDTVILDSTDYGKYLPGNRMSVHSYYIPKTKGLYGLVKVGFSGAPEEGEGKSPFNGQVIAGYQFTPKFSLGGGVGFAKNYGKFSYHTDWSWDNYRWERIISTEFPVSFIPVFLDLRFNANKKKVVPYFALDLGCSFPVTQEVNGTWGATDPLYGWAFHVNKINPGFYFAINPGLKIYLYSKYYLDLSMGWDICVNKFKGNLPNDYSQKTKSTSNFHMNVGFGF